MQATIRINAQAKARCRATLTRPGEWLFRRIWLPKALYEALPWLYLAGGGAALVSGLLMPEPVWIFGYLLLPGLALIHMGLYIGTLRRRARLKQRRARARPDRVGGRVGGMSQCLPRERH